MRFWSHYGMIFESDNVHCIICVELTASAIRSETLRRVLCHKPLSDVGRSIIADIGSVFVNLLNYDLPGSQSQDIFRKMLQATRFRQSVFMELQLLRPLVIFDLESTGVFPERDRIVELAVLKIFPDGSSQSAVRRLNPGIPIPPSATAIHGIADADVADCPSFETIAANLARYLDCCDLGGYNVVNFDIPMLQAEFQRAGIPLCMKERNVVDVYQIFCKLFPRTLTAAYKLYCGRELMDAHSADADTCATWEVLSAQLKRHPELPRGVEALAAFSGVADPDALDQTRRFKWRNGEVVVNFGKNAGRSLNDIAVNDPGFLRWIVRSDFPEDARTIAKNALSGIFPERK